MSKLVLAAVAMVISNAQHLENSEIVQSQQSVELLDIAEDPVGNKIANKAIEIFNVDTREGTKFDEWYQGHKAEKENRHHRDRNSSEKREHQIGRQQDRKERRQEKRFGYNGKPRNGEHPPQCDDSSTPKCTDGSELDMTQRRRPCKNFDKPICADGTEARPPRPEDFPEEFQMSDEDSEAAAAAIAIFGTLFVGLFGMIWCCVVMAFIGCGVFGVFKIYGNYNRNKKEETQIETARDKARNRYNNAISNLQQAERGLANHGIPIPQVIAPQVPQGYQMNETQELAQTESSEEYNIQAPSDLV